MAVITLTDTIEKEIQEVVKQNETIVSIDFNEFYINPNMKVLTFEVEYYDADEDLVKTEQKRLEGDVFDAWLMKEFATFMAVRESLKTYLVDSGEITGGTDTTPVA